MNVPRELSLTVLVDAYCDVWCEPDPETRRQKLALVCSPSATYTYPTVHATNGDELLAHIAKVLARRPGAKVMRTSAIDEHHGCIRFAWHVVQADGTALPKGIDFMDVASDGKIQRIIGFFGPLQRTASSQ